MVFADALTKAGRLMELHGLFCRNPARSWSTGELAARLGTSLRTVRNYLLELSTSGRLPIVRDHRRWHLVPEARFEIPPVSFLLEEAAAVYLAARLLCRHSDQPNPAVRGAVAKLAAVVPFDLGETMALLATRVCTGPDDHFAAMFRAVATGWALRRELLVEYHPLSASGPRPYRFRPYLLEPAVRGFAVYAIGHAEPPGELRVFKVERLTAATLTTTPFEAPPVPELMARLDSSWGIWLADGDDVQICLRFTSKVARAVRETRWHPSQRLIDLPDGGVEVHLAMTSTVELVPWILGWGAECEVMEPAPLRKEVAEAHRGAVGRYAMG